MPLTINEEISALEAELVNVKGPGSVEKKKEIQARIDALKAEDKPTEAEEVKTPTRKRTNRVNNEIPPYKKATKERILQAEKEGKLCGVDYETMTASIKE